MQKSAKIIAIVGLVAGTSAGMAALDTNVREIPPGEPVAVTQPDALSGDEMQVAHAESTVATVVESAAPVSVTTAPAEPDRHITIPFLNVRLKVVTSPTIPAGMDESSPHQHLINAYFDRKNAGVMLTGAPGPVFPIDAEHPRPLPAMVAYLERVEAQRIAALTPAVSANAETPVYPVAIQPPAGESVPSDTTPDLQARVDTSSGSPSQ